MDTFVDLRTALQSDLTVDSTSTIFSVPSINLAINRAYRKAAGMFKWPKLRDALKTSTVSGQEYYDFPDNWSPNSIYRLEVDGSQYGESPDGSPLLFDDYLIFRNDPTFANSTDLKWSVDYPRYMIYPVPLTNGNNNISIWGKKVVSTLSQDTDTTIFSYSMPECNEAIVLEALSILRIKGGEQPVRLLKYVQGALFLSMEAQQILTTSWGKLREDQNKYEKIQPFFDVPNFFPNRRRGGNKSTNSSDGSPISNF